MSIINKLLFNITILNLINEKDDHTSIYDFLLLYLSQQQSFRVSVASYLTLCLFALSLTIGSHTRSDQLITGQSAPLKTIINSRTGNIRSEVPA